MTTEFSISNATVDVDQFISQFQTVLNQKETWKGTLTTQTSSTLVDLISTVGTFNTAALLRYFEDAFPDTVQSDGAIRAIALMSGLRLSRKAPSAVTVQLTSEDDAVLSPYSQFNVGGVTFFNRVVLNFEAGVTQEVELYEGTIHVVGAAGLGTNLQAFVSNEDSFTVSDSDVRVAINGVLIPKAYGGLWSYENQAAYSDLTHSDGRLLIQFGSQQYGSVPGVNDVVAIVYAVTRGLGGNTLVTINKRIVCVDNDKVTGLCTTNPTGGADEKDPLSYKNVESGAFGTYSSAVTKYQYKAIVNTYPGIVDAKTQAQREINPRAVEWMNVIRVSALTSSPWTSAQKKEFCKYAQEVSMYAPFFVWQDPVAVPRDVALVIYCFNTAIPSVVEQKVRAAIESMFAPQPGILMTNFYESDLVEVAFNAAPGEISYVKVITPASGEMIVTSPESPSIDSNVVVGAGILTPLVYAYGISVVLPDGEEGPPTNWTFPQVLTGQQAAVSLSWVENKAAAFYKIWGRKATQLGLLATIPAGTLSWVDDGSTSPTGAAPNSLSDVPIRYNQLRELDIKVEFSSRQQKVNLG